MPPFLSKRNYWYKKEPHSEIDIQCMLPNGVCITLYETRADTPLSKIKSDLWQKAQQYALFHLLRPKDSYVFVVVSGKGGIEELLDEDVSLFDLKPARPYLKTVLMEGDEAKKKMNQRISLLLGRSLTATSKDEEVDEFRKLYTDFCEGIAKHRGQSCWEERAIYTYPPEIEDNEVSEKISKKLKNLNNKLHITVTLQKNINPTFEIYADMFPKDLLVQALRKKANTLKLTHLGNTDDYILKVVGRESYFLGYMLYDNNSDPIYTEKPIKQYKYIQECLLWDKRPKLALVEKSKLKVEPLIRSLTFDEAPPLPPKISEKTEISLWALNSTTQFKIKIVCGLNITGGTKTKEVKCGLFHGGEQVCPVKSTSQKDGINPCWNEYLTFDLAVCDLPRMAKLCFCILGFRKNDQKKRRATPIAWVNIPIFDYRGMLRMGPCRLQCWPYSSAEIAEGQATQNFLKPLGTVSSSGNDNGPCILVEFTKFVHTVAYPSDEHVLELASNVVGQDKNNHPFLTRGSKVHRENIEEIVQKDSLTKISEKDRELLWRLRAECCLDFPHSLPKLLQCVKWNSREDVAQTYFLLQTWNTQDLEVEIALDLLDYKFPDIKVRKLAVDVLSNLSDSDLELYLLQLVQALKYELYLHSPLARYLLKRALNNRRIGHFLFWHLKADIANPEVSLQFGLLLEMYCRGSPGHIECLLRQSEAVNKMKTVTELLKHDKREEQGTKKDQDDPKLKLMRDCFSDMSYKKAFADIISPLDPRYLLKALRVEKCKYMNSAKKPLWLVFENGDEEGDDVIIMFKNGDDLRQDMLTLQTLRLMDSVWKDDNLDMCLTPYRCLSTGDMLGLIEVVQDADTIAKIQNKAGTFTGVLRGNAVYSHMEEQGWNKDDTKRQVMLDNFIRSVAGYSVATYVLGIGDRHNDNIMLKNDTGQLFHIDFGHFLGHFKSKFGIKRERVKFVLPRDFLYIIEKEETIEEFRNKCVEAFKVLRCRGNLFVMVFAMLLSTGIPELKQPKDLDYIRETLAMDKSENEAIKIFDASFDQAVAEDFFTTSNFLIHNIKHYWVG